MKSKAHGEAPLTPMLECVEYPAQCPCRLRSRVSEIDEYLVPHYATSLEIILTEGVDGYVVIGTNRFDITRDRNGVFVIPPNVVHYTMFRAGSGRIHVFKLSMELIADYMNVGRLFALHGHTMEDAPGFLPERYAEFAEILFRQISYDWQDSWRMFDGLIALFRLMEGKSTTFCCYECGFTNLSYFISLFRRYTGCSTVEYRHRQGLPADQDDKNSEL